MDTAGARTVECLTDGIDVVLTDGGGSRGCGGEGSELDLYHIVCCVLYMGYVLVQVGNISYAFSYILFVILFLFIYLFFWLWLDELCH